MKGLLLEPFSIKKKTWANINREIPTLIFREYRNGRKAAFGGCKWRKGETLISGGPLRPLPSLRPLRYSRKKNGFKCFHLDLK